MRSTGGNSIRSPHPATAQKEKLLPKIIVVHFSEGVRGESGHAEVVVYPEGMSLPILAMFQQGQHNGLEINGHKGALVPP